MLPRQPGGMAVDPRAAAAHGLTSAQSQATEQFAAAAAALGQLKSLGAQLAAPMQAAGKAAQQQSTALTTATRGMQDYLRVVQQVQRVEQERARVKPAAQAAF